jgi:hypothetical protein
MEYRSVSNEQEAREAALRWLAQRLCFEAWLEGERAAAPEPRRGLSAAA